MGSLLYMICGVATANWYYNRASVSLDLCVLFDAIDAPTGGGNQFLKALAIEFAAMGHRVTGRPTRDTEAVLLNGFNYASGKPLRVRQVAQLRQTGRMSLLGELVPIPLQLRRARRGPVLIHRVDGVPELVRGKRTAADEVQPAVDRLTDHTIFQTQYCRDSFVQHCGISPANWRIINNAVDPALFYPDANVDAPDGTLRLVAVSWSANIRKGFPALADISRLPGVELTFVGRWCPEVDPADVKLAGVRDSRGVADILRFSHAMVHAAYEEPCSNAIVEAMACGLPVVYRDSGGNRELAEEYGVALSDDYRADIDSLRQRYSALREKVLTDRPRFLISRAAKEYLSLFRQAIAGHYHGRRYVPGNLS